MYDVNYIERKVFVKKILIATVLACFGVNVCSDVVGMAERPRVSEAYICRMRASIKSLDASSDFDRDKVIDTLLNAVCITSRTTARLRLIDEYFFRVFFNVFSEANYSCRIDNLLKEIVLRPYALIPFVRSFSKYVYVCGELEGVCIELSYCLFDNALELKDKN